MNRKTHRLHIICCALLSLALCFIGQRFAYRFLQDIGARHVAPNGLDTTMIRLQNLSRLQGDVVIMGSSMTERLIASRTTAVVGVPGSSFLAALSLIDKMATFPHGSTYVIETDNLFNGIYQEVIDRTEQWDFRMFQDSAHFSIAAKPCNLILSGIFTLLKPELRLNAYMKKLDIQQQPEDLSLVPAPTEQELTNWKELMDGVAEIRNRGGRVCMVRFPTKKADMYNESYDNACKLAKHMGIPVLNYNNDFWRNRLVFSDSNHLKSQDPGTAVFRETIASDAKACAR